MGGLFLYKFYDQDNPLGLHGRQTGTAKPSNYIERDVGNSLAPFCDANGDRKPDYPFEIGSIVGIGENHAGYIGFRDSTNNKLLTDDGAMGVVVNNWKNSTITKKNYASSVTEC